MALLPQIGTQDYNPLPTGVSEDGSGPSQLRLCGIVTMTKIGEACLSPVNAGKVPFESECIIIYDELGLLGDKSLIIGLCVMPKPWVHV